MIETIVKVFLRDKAGNLDSFTTTINLPNRNPMPTISVGRGIWASRVTV